MPSGSTPPGASAWPIPADQPYPQANETLYGAPATYGADPQAQPFWKNRRNLVLGGVAAIVLVLVIAGIVIAALGSDGSKFEVGGCVKQAGDQAKPVGCSTQGSYTIVSKVDNQEKCPDKGQPFAVLQRKGSPDQVLCLKPTR